MGLLPNINRHTMDQNTHKTQSNSTTAAKATAQDCEDRTDRQAKGIFGECGKSERRQGLKCHARVK